MPRTNFRTRKLRIEILPAENEHIEIQLHPQSGIVPHFEGPAGNQAFAIIQGLEKAFGEARLATKHEIDHRAITIAPREGQNGASLMTDVSNIMAGLLKKKDIIERGDAIRGDADPAHIQVALSKALRQRTHAKAVETILNENHLTAEARSTVLERLREEEAKRAEREEGGRA